MNGTIFSILLVLIGLFVGITIMLVLNQIKLFFSTKKANLIVDDAKKEADKLKRDSILEAKEEVHKLRIETEKEIKEKKTGNKRFRSSFTFS